MRKFVFVAMVALLVGCEQKNDGVSATSPEGSEPGVASAKPRIPANVKTAVVPYGVLTTAIDDPKIGREITTEITFVVPQGKEAEVNDAINKNLLAVKSMLVRYFSGVAAARIAQEDKLARMRTELQELTNGVLWPGKTGKILDVNLTNTTISNAPAALK